MLVLMFPGQGSQRPGMGAPWQEQPSWHLVERIGAQVDMDVGHLLVTAGAEELRATENAQMATFVLSAVILDALEGELGPALPGRLLAVAGHSLGEYSALVAARALGPLEGGRLVRARGQAMEAAAAQAEGTMAAVLGLGIEEVVAACAAVSGAWVANDNSPGQVVISGTPTGVAAAGEEALRQGAKRVVPLQVGGAFHSPLMAPAQASLDVAIARAAFSPPRCPVVANVDAQPHTDGFASLLTAQLCSLVRWRASLATLRSMGASLFVELGPGTELSGMVKRTLDGAVRANVATPDQLATAAAAIEALAL